MKIAMVSPYSWAHPGGVNNHIEGLAREMIRRGSEVTIIAPDSGREVDGALFVSAGRSVPVPANGSIARLAIAPGTSSKVRRAVSSGFDVVHVHEPLVPFVSTAAVSAAPGRVVATFHAAGGRSTAYALGRLAFGGLAGKLDSRIAVSASALALASRYLPGDYEVIPNGVDLSRFTLRSPGSDGPRSGGRVVLFVGRNEKRKGLSVLLDALPALVSKVPDVELVVVGTGYKSRGTLPGLPGHLKEHVRVEGYVPNDELPSYFASADVFCAPALGGESFGVVLIEAMACGTPVIASDIPGYSDVVEETGGGLLFETGSPEDLAEKLTRVLTGAETADELSTKGLKGVERFSWTALGDRIESCYLSR